jgi:hypothetical protein
MGKARACGARKDYLQTLYGADSAALDSLRSSRAERSNHCCGPSHFGKTTQGQAPLVSSLWKNQRKGLELKKFERGLDELVDAAYVWISSEDNLLLLPHLKHILLFEHLPLIQHFPHVKHSQAMYSLF